MTRRRRAARGLLVAALVLALAEGGAALLGLGAWQPFFVPAIGPDGSPWRVVNPRVGENWFRTPGWEAEVRSPRSGWVRAEKPAGLVRVLVLGESSAYGTPLDDHATWARQFEAQLRAGLGGRPVELLNLAVRAVTLSVVLDALPELLALDPDLVVLYAGHNEAYGVRPRGFPRTTHLWRAVEDLRLGEATPALRAARVGLQADERSPAGGAEERAIAERFAADLDALVGGLGGVPLLVYVVHGNERDLAPLCSEEGPDPEAARQSGALVAAVGAAPQAALGEACDPARLAAVPGHAGLRWAAGWCAFNDGDLAAARAAFREAVDLDCAPVRIRSSGRAVLGALPGRHPGAPVAVVDPEAALRAASPGGVLGHEVFYDHVHLTIEGSFLVARAGALTMARHPGVFGLPLDEAALPDRDATLSLQRVSAVDAWLALARMDRYLDQSVVRDTASVPWARALLAAESEALWADLDPLARAVLQRPGAVHGEAHLDLALALERAGDPQGALAEAQAAVAARPACAPCRAALARLLAAHDAAAARDQAAMAEFLDGQEER